jgi:tripartite-type tricarboxylate transporter receptor subunit TctC
MTKNLNRSAGLSTALLISTAVSYSPFAAAQAYPTKPIRFLVASAPGGAPDILARTVAQKLSESFGQQVVVDNRAGASGVVGAELAAKSPSDGHTLFLSTTTLFAILPNLRAKLPYDPVKDFTSITQIASASNVLVVNAAVPAKSVAELVALGRSKPDSLNYASAGNGTPAHLAGEMLNLMANLKMTHVPYKGAGPALIDVIAGQVQLIVTSPIAAGPHIANGKVRALATTGEKRSPALPDLPTVNDTLPGYLVTQWWGLSVPARTPAAIVTRLHAETVKALQLSDVRERLSRDGAVAVGGSGKAFDEFIAAERARFGKVIKQAKVQMDG